ncbi:MAG: 4-(cytidine 5'-diphospho)-2-C-methyl-D-erythritol kinase [Cyclobacteriaceae bacterium]
MLCFPNAKINLGLNIVSKRPDGYHNIETCFYPIPCRDILEIIPSEKLSFHPTGLDIPGTPETNLCSKAYSLVRSEYDIPPVDIHLHKVIPMGAGLGGGSADGAFMIKLLNDKFGLGMHTEKMESMAKKLGSDCPFFIQNQPLFAEGTGTIFSEVALNLKGKFIALRHPDIHVSTQEAYGGVKPSQPSKSIKEIINQPLETWKHELINDFEASVFSKHPELQNLKEQFYTEGAIYAGMSGSGSCVFGIFDEEPINPDWKTFLL